MRAHTHTKNRHWAAGAILLATMGVFLDTSRSTAAIDGQAPALRVGPVNGPCFYSNTYGAPRSSGRLHVGVDVIAASGTPLVAVVDGVISKLIHDRPGAAGNGGGNYLRVQTSDGSYYTYLHLLAFADGIAQGVRVSAGQVIGYVGQTGAAATPHLHFEVHPQGGDPVDPTPYVIAVGTCGPPSDQGVPKPRAVVLTPHLPLSPAVREGVIPVVRPAEPVVTSVDAPADVTPTAPAVPFVTDATGSSQTVPFPTEPPQSLSPDTTPGAGLETTTTTTPPPLPPAAQAGPAEGGVVVFRSPAAIPARRVVGITVVGFPGLPNDGSVVRLAITTTADVSGVDLGAEGAPNRAAVWPCGQRAGLDRGAPLLPLAAGSAVTSMVELVPGDEGRICMVIESAAFVEVAVLRG